MVKVIELLIVFALLIFSFFTGVKYSKQVKEHASWLFENKDEEVELPEIDGQTPMDMQDDQGGMNHGNPSTDDVPMDSIRTDEDDSAATNPTPAAPAAPAQVPNQNPGQNPGVNSGSTPTNR